MVSVEIAEDRSVGADRWLVGLRTADGGTGGGGPTAPIVVVVTPGDCVGDCAAVYLRPPGGGDRGNSPTAESGVGECTILCGESNGSPVGFGFGNRSDRSIRGGRSLRFELLDPLEWTDWEAVSGLPDVLGVSLEAEVSVGEVVSRALK